MNKFRVVGLAVALAVGTSFAQGSLWDYKTTYGIVKFPWVVTCLLGDDFDESNRNDPCFKEQGGWWFGYVAGPSAGAVRDACGLKSQMSDVNKVMVHFKTGPVTFVGPDAETCLGPDVTYIEDDGENTAGTSKLENGLRLTMTIGPGNPEKYDPDIASFAVNLGVSANEAQSLPPEPARNLENKKGFCITYASDHVNTLEGEAGSNVALELGWNEHSAITEEDEEKTAFDTWYAVIPDGAGINVPKTAHFTWEGSLVTSDRYTPNTIGGFKQDNWAPAPWSIQDATQQMRAVKIRLKGYEATTVEFNLLEFGWFGECGTSPVVSAKVADAVSFNMVGKIVNMAVAKPATVQVINLHGKVVHTQTLTPANQKMNLSNLPTGVYMLRAPSLGYTNKIVLK